jgi:hypothetical protein
MMGEETLGRRVALFNAKANKFNSIKITDEIFFSRKDLEIDRHVIEMVLRKTFPKKEPNHYLTLLNMKDNKSTDIDEIIKTLRGNEK